MQHLDFATQPATLSDRVWWIGALDPKLRNFDIILKTANGTTYNSYLIKGSEGVAIIDTVKEEFTDVFFQKIESLVSYDDIKIIVLNHLEPDHTGALPELLKRAPHACVYISFRAQNMLKGLLKTDTTTLDYIPVNTNDTVNLGDDLTLRFLNTPYLHWPDTQCTYFEEEQILFSGDAFGCHFCDNRLYNDLVGDFRFSFEYYYAHIMRPFKNHVFNALNLIEPLSLNIIAPAHGPILRDNPQQYVKRFRELSTTKLENECATDKTLLVFYISSYGNTSQMAQAIYQGASSVTGIRVSLYDLEGGEVEPFVDLIEGADGIVLGTPTINGDAVKPMWDLLSSLTVVNIKGKVGAAFGSYGWSGEAVKMLEDRMRGLKLKVPLEGLRIKLIPNSEELEQCRKFGIDLAKITTGQQEERTLRFENL